MLDPFPDPNIPNRAFVSISDPTLNQFINKIQSEGKD